jgi:hypothetical protein
VRLGRDGDRAGEEAIVRTSERLTALVMKAKTGQEALEIKLEIDDALYDVKKQIAEAETPSL